MGFLPNDYKEPVMSNYMDFVEGENTFRVLGSAKIGWEYWTKDDRSVRVEKYETIPLKDVKVGKYGLNLSFFWAFPVYNFSARKIQILVVKQKTVREGMLSYINNKKWGDPTEYNFVVTRSEEDGRTKYHTIAEPKEDLDQEVLDKFEDMEIDMDVWFRGDDPFMGITQDEVVEKEEPEVDAEDVADDVPF